MRSGQESYAQAQKGMPLPSLPGESLPRQIPTRGIKQVRPALPSTRLASLRAYGAPVGSQSLLPVGTGVELRALQSGASRRLTFLSRQERQGG